MELDQLRDTYAQIVGDMTAQGCADDEIVAEVRRCAGAMTSSFVLHVFVIA